MPVAQVENARPESAPAHQDSPAALKHEIERLVADVHYLADRRLANWLPQLDRRRFRIAAHNLAHYLALRQFDIRDIQTRLARLGLSSLGRSESHVLPTLTALLSSLQHIEQNGVTAPYPPRRAFERGARILAANAKEVLGDLRPGKSAHIMATVGDEAAQDPAFTEQLVKNGASLFRINCGHGNPDSWTAIIASIRRASNELGLPCRIQMDIDGPHARTGAVTLPDKKHRVMRGDRFLMRMSGSATDLDFPVQVECLLPEVFSTVTAGDMVWFDDGKMGAQVEESRPDGLVLRVVNARPNGFRLRPEKGLNFPGVRLPLSPLTAKDLRDLDFVARNADVVGYSFVQTPEDVRLLQEELALRLGSAWRRLPVVLKIETSSGVRLLPEIIVQAAGRQPTGVMIARGDLAVEIGYERLAEMQEELLWVCEAAYVPVVWATEVLARLVSKGSPSRAEITDAAMSARSECVMLNKGEYLPEAVTALSDILGRMSEHQLKKSPRLRALKTWQIGELN